MNKLLSESIKKYKVSIFGESYFLVSDESEEHLVAAAHFVDNCMREIAQKSQIADSKRIAVLVALQLASKALSTRETIEQQQCQSDKLIELVDRELSRFNTL